MTRDQQIRLQNFAMLIGVLSLLGMFIFGMLHMGPPAPAAKASVRPQWDGIAGEANHACYHDGGVQQVTGYIAGEGFVFVCRDGWAMMDENS